MKKLIPFLALLVGTATALAQGTVSFVNSGAFPTAADRNVYLDRADGTAPIQIVGTNYSVQLWYGADASSLQAHSAAPSRFRATTTSSPGTWSGGTRTLEGFTAGQVVTFQLRAFDNTGGPGVGQSDIFTYTIPAAGSPPAQFLMDNFRSFTVLVPEPSVIGLGLIGVGALVWLRRRKA